MKVAILIGHGKGDSGGYDPGACAQGFQEFTLAKEVGRYATEALGRYDCSVELVNYGGNLNLPERIKYCNAREYDLIVECHLNSAAEPAYGCEVYHSNGDAKGKALAAAISKGISGALGIRDRGARTKLTNTGADYFGIIRRTKPTALLVETCFINSSDVFTIRDAAGQRRAGEAMASAIADKLGLTKKEETAVMKGVRYIGDFGSPLTASMLCEVIGKGGHSCEVVPYGGKWGVLVTRLKPGVSLGDFVGAVELLTGYYNCKPEQKVLK